MRFSTAEIVVSVVIPCLNEEDAIADVVRGALAQGVDEVVVVEKHPFDGPLVVSVDGTDRTLGERVARQIYVTRRGHRNGDLDTPSSGRDAAPATQRKHA